MTTWGGGTVTTSISSESKAGLNAVCRGADYRSGDSSRDSDGWQITTKNWWR